MKRCILAILIATSYAGAQTSVPAQPAVPAFTVPAPDGKTIISTNNVWSCTTARTTLPTGMTFNGTLLTVLQISTTSIS